MQDMASGPFSAILDNLAIVIPTLVALVVAIVVYLVLMVRAIIDMCKRLNGDAIDTLRAINI